MLMALRPSAFQACFVNWLTSLRATAAEATGVDQPILAVDGKTGAAEPRSQEWPKRLAFGQRLGERVWLVARTGSVC